MIRRRHARPGFGLLGTLGIALALTACDSPTETTPTLSLWEGSLTPINPNTVTGLVAAVSQFGRTEISIEIREAEPGEAYSWRIEGGSCELPGEIQGRQDQYESLFPDESGIASRGAVLAIEFRSGQRFAAGIYQPTEGGGEEIVACGELQEIR